jgi:hypothetical protein
MEVVYWGTTVNLQEVVDEAARILPVAEAEGAKPHWDPAEVQAKIAAQEKARKESGSGQ